MSEIGTPFPADVPPPAAETERRELHKIPLSEFRTMSDAALARLFDSSNADILMVTPKEACFVPREQHILVGRSEESDIVIPNNKVSRRQMTVRTGYMAPGIPSIEVEDLSSVGTRIIDGSHFSTRLAHETLTFPSNASKPVYVECGSIGLHMVGREAAMPQLPYAIRPGNQEAVRVFLSAHRALPFCFSIQGSGERIFPLRKGNNTFLKIWKTDRNRDYYDNVMVNDIGALIKLREDGFQYQVLAYVTANETGITEITDISNGQLVNPKQNNLEDLPTPIHRPPERLYPDGEPQKSSIIEHTVNGVPYQIDMKKLLNRTDSALLPRAEQETLARETIVAWDTFCRAFGDQIPPEMWDAQLLDLTEIVASSEWGTEIAMGRNNAAGHHHDIVQIHNGIPHVVSLQLESVQRKLRKDPKRFYQLALHEWLHHYDLRSRNRLRSYQFTGIMEGFVNLYSLVGVKALDDHRPIQDIIADISDEEIEDLAHSFSHPHYAHYTVAMRELSKKFGTNRMNQQSDLTTMMKIMFTGHQTFADVVGRNVRDPLYRSEDIQGTIPRGEAILQHIQFLFNQERFDEALSYIKRLTSDSNATLLNS